MSASPPVPQDFQAISFPEWKARLAAAALAPEVRERFRGAILTLLKVCKERRRPVSVALIREHLAVACNAAAAEALRWFYLEARRSEGGTPGLRSEAKAGGDFNAQRLTSNVERLMPDSADAGLAAGEIVTEKAEILKSRTGHSASEISEASGAVRAVTGGTRVPLSEKNAGAGTRPPTRRSGEAPVAAADQGGAEWERALIAAARVRGFAWRTEETYRMWGAQFARFLAPQEPEAAGAAEVAAFLSELAVTRRVSPSTQKQALNALVFLMQEGLHRTLGEIRFRRAAPRARMPVVLSRAECQRLLAELDGTTKLMAELMYGSGLRLMELLRLRVQHLDFEQGQLRVASGKGDKDRVTVLPTKLTARLQAHLVRLKALWAEDRAAGLPGVWLPEGLARTCTSSTANPARRMRPANGWSGPADQTASTPPCFTALRMVARPLTE